MQREREITLHADKRGNLFELFRTAEHDVAMAYCVTTKVRQARDAKVWHFHKHKTETFIPVKGVSEILVATYPNKGLGALIRYRLDAQLPWAITVLPGELHSVRTPDGFGSATLVVLCDKVYDPEDEHRLEMTSDWGWGDVGLRRSETKLPGT